MENYTVKSNLGNSFVEAEDEKRILCLCSRELDAQLIAKALNAQRATVMMEASVGAASDRSPKQDGLGLV